MFFLFISSKPKQILLNSTSEAFSLPVNAVLLLQFLLQYQNKRYLCLRGDKTTTTTKKKHSIQTFGILTSAFKLHSVQKATLSARFLGRSAASRALRWEKKCFSFAGPPPRHNSGPFL